MAQAAEDSPDVYDDPDIDYDPPAALDPDEELLLFANPDPASGQASSALSEGYKMHRLLGKRLQYLEMLWRELGRCAESAVRQRCVQAVNRARGLLMRMRRRVEGDPNRPRDGVRMRTPSSTSEDLPQDEWADESMRRYRLETELLDRHVEMAALIREQRAGGALTPAERHRIQGEVRILAEKTKPHYEFTLGHIGPPLNVAGYHSDLIQVGESHFYEPMQAYFRENYRLPRAVTDTYDALHGGPK